MPLESVSEARPIAWSRLSEFERDRLREAYGWIAKVYEEAKDPKPPANAIDQNRKGRVLFIDGPRGTGKTSLLLTLLAGWQESASTKIYRNPDQQHLDISVLLPILDFDPLPRGMPLHGWLLEPWRKEAERLEGVGDVSAHDLSVAWSDLFERAVIGWTEAAVGGKGVVEKAIAYQEMASGWIDTRALWTDFVNASICKYARCRIEKCPASHSVVFVIAIDDVDLQVEQVAQLLHAIRLFHHPNVVYVLTGDYRHLEFAVELDYVDRHSSRAIGRPLAPTRTLGELWHRTEQFSRSLREAFLEKALPPHARIELEVLDAQAVIGLSLPVPAQEKIGDVLPVEWKKVTEAEVLKKRPLISARKAQHAIDRRIKRNFFDNGKLTGSNAARFIADICQADIDENDQKRLRSSIRGTLTTRVGHVRKEWRGDQLRIILTDPDFIFQKDFDLTYLGRNEEATRALLIRLCVEAGELEAPALSWRPDAGCLSTETQWTSRTDGIEGRAIFHWPWYKRPRSSQVSMPPPFTIEGTAGLNQTNLEDSEGPSRSDLKTGEMVFRWLLMTINWERSDETTSLTGLIALLEKEISKATADNNLKEEIDRWVREIMIMTAPYYGLPEELGILIRKEFDNSLALRAKKDDVKWYQNNRVVRHAILLGQQGVFNSDMNDGEKRVLPSSADVSVAVETFISYHRERWPGNSWWTWLGAS